MDFAQKETHPSYGMLAFHRVSGGDPNLFGSSVKHNQKILLALKEGHVRRDLNTNWYGGDRTLFEVEMSYTQFADLISAMNVGDGVPVTIRYTKELGQVKGMPITNPRKQFLDEFSQKNADAEDDTIALLEKLQAIFSEKRALRASEKEDILRTLDKIKASLTSHNDFMIRQFDETMEKITTEAKGEVEAFVQTKMQTLALSALRDQLEPGDLAAQNPLLTEGD
jgi:hypothetical protein